MSWIYNHTVFHPEDIPEKAVGFIYQMTVEIEEGIPLYYIGKKNFSADVKTKLGKKVLATVKDKRLKKYKRVKKLTYENYYSSNEVLIKAHKEGKDIYREILQICYSKSELTYSECKWLFLEEVLEHEEYLNNNILGKFYRGKIK